MLQVLNVKKEYQMGRRRLEVLHGVSLRVERGEFLCIAGRSGAGKSTLLHVMGLLDTPTEGSIFYEGRNLSMGSERMRAFWRNRLFGFVFQFYNLLPDFDAQENVWLPGMVEAGVGNWRKRKKELSRRAAELLGMVGLKDRVAHRPSQLSGGEKQRVAIARALINEPEVLLCDEPTGNLDVRTGETILDLLHSVRTDTGCTLVMVTHERGVAARAERLLELVDGRIAEERPAASAAP